MINIYSKSNELIANSAKYSYDGAYMGDRSVRVEVSSPDPIDFGIYSYVEYRGERFELDYAPSAEKTASDGSVENAYKYDLKFVSLKYELERCIMRDIVLGDNSVHYSGLTAFSFFGDVQTLAYRIKANLDKLYAGENKWLVSVQKDSEAKDLSFDATNCWNALAMVKSEFDLNFSVKGRVITIGDAGRVLPVKLRYGMNNGLYKITRTVADNEAVVTRLIAYGSDRNLPRDYNKKDLVPESQYITRLMLPNYSTTLIDHIESGNKDTYGIREAVQVFEDIYPSIWNTTATDLINAGGSTTASGRLDEFVAISPIVDPKQPDFNVWIKDIGFDISNHLTPNPAQISVKDGNLGGYTLDVVKCEIDDSVAGAKYKLTLNRNQDDGFPMPDAITYISPGDHFVILQIYMPDAYILMAEQKLLASAKEYLEQHDHSKLPYSVGVDELFMARNRSLRDTICEGDLMPIEDAGLGVDLNIIIQHLTIKHEPEKIPTFDVQLSDEPEVGTLDRIQNSISSIENGLKSNASIERTPSNIEVLRTIFHPIGGREDLDIKGKDVRAGRAFSPFVSSPDFLASMIGYGFGAYVDEHGASHIYADHAHFRGSFETIEMRYRKMLVSGEELVVNNGGVVERVFSGSRFLRTRDHRYVITQDGMYIHVPSDGVVSFELKGVDGVDLRQFEENDIVRYTWRDKATSVSGGSGYLMIIGYAGDFSYEAEIISGSPETLKAGMTLALFGNLTNPDRQGFVVISSRDRNIAIYDGVKSQVISKEHLKVLLGNLNGVVDENMPEIKGYGLYSKNCYLTGDFIVRNTGESVGQSLSSVKAQAALAEKRLENWASDKIVSPTEKSGIMQFYEKAKRDKAEVDTEARRWYLLSGAPYKRFQSAWTNAEAAYIKYTQVEPENIPIDSSYGYIAAFNVNVVEMHGLFNAASKETLESYYNTLRSEISQTEDSISISVTAIEKNVTDLGKNLTKSDARITVNEAAIGLRVQKGDIINQINVTEEKVAISGGKIDLTGAVSINNNVKINPDGTLYARNGVFSGTVNASGGVFSGDIYATGGKIQQRILVGDGGHIDASGIAFNGSMIFSSIGDGCFDPASGRASAARFENIGLGAGGIAMYASSTRSHAIHVERGTFSGLNLFTQQLDNSSNGILMSPFVSVYSCYNTKDITIYLPRPDSVTTGHQYLVRQNGGGNISVNGIIFSNQPRSQEWAGGERGWLASFINDGSYWLFNRQIW